MRNMMKIFAVVVTLVVLSGCATTNFGPQWVKGKAYGTTALEASLAQYNYSLAGVLAAVEKREISPERAAVLMETVTPVGDRNQKKNVHIQKSEHKSIHTSGNIGSSSNSGDPNCKALADKVKF